MPSRAVLVVSICYFPTPALSGSGSKGIISAGISSSTPVLITKEFCCGFMSINHNLNHHIHTLHLRINPGKALYRPITNHFRKAEIIPKHHTPPFFASHLAQYIRNIVAEMAEHGKAVVPFFHCSLFLVHCFIHPTDIEQ